MQIYNLIRLSHALRSHQAIKVPAIEVAETNGFLTQGGAVGVRGFGNLGGLVVADGGRERGHEHQRALHQLVDPLFVGAEAGARGVDDECGGGQIARRRSGSETAQRNFFREWRERGEERVEIFARAIGVQGAVTAATLAYTFEGGKPKAFVWRSRVAPAGHPCALGGLSAIADKAKVNGGYGRIGGEDGVVVVSPPDGVIEPVSRSGDEPQMLARALPGVPVIVSAEPPAV